MTVAGAPSVIVFDVNETLSDMSPMSRRWQDVGVPGHLAQQWFAEVLRDGFALAAAGSAAAFSTIAAATAARLLGSEIGGDELPAAVGYIMAGFAELDVHPDVPEGMRALSASGIRLVTLSNGSTDVADELLRRTDLRPHVEALLSVQDARRWKPAPEAYAYAVDRCGVPAGAMMLVAVHPWDIDGAARAGLRTTWINRSGGPYPDFFHAPELTVPSLTDLATLWGNGAPGAPGSVSAS